MKWCLAALWAVLMLALPLQPRPARAAEPFDPATLEARFVGDDLVLGKPDAPVTVVEYLSGACPYCAAFDREVFPYVAEAYIASGKVRYVIREIPTAPVALSASGFLLARCAGQERYLSVLEFMFHNRESLLTARDAREAIMRVGAAGGLDEEATEACLDDEAALEKLNDRIQAALKAGVEATPTFVFGGRMLKAGEKLANSVYAGGPLSAAQFDDAYRKASMVSGK